MYTYENRVMNISNILIKKQSKMTSSQQKLFYIILTEFSKGNFDEFNRVLIPQNEIFKIFNISGNGKYNNLKRQVKTFLKNSIMTFERNELLGDSCYKNDDFVSLSLFTEVSLIDNYLNFYINQNYKNLIVDVSQNFTRLLSSDLLSFDSKFSIFLYQKLMQMNCYNKCFKITTKQLKEIFCLEKYSYLRKDGSFARSVFENKTLKVAIKEINEKSKCIRNIKYIKEKNGKKVKFYVLSFDYIDPNEFTNYKKNNNYLFNDINNSNYLNYDLLEKSKKEKYYDENEKFYKEICEQYNENLKK